jgi:hypothetical protein
MIENFEQASSNFFWTITGRSGEYNIQTTLRGALSPEQVAEHFQTVLLGLSEVGLIGGKAANKGGSATSQVQDNSFVIDEVVITIDKNKTYAKVLGGNFKQHGVRLWFEPLVAAGIIESEEEFNTLDPRNPPQLKGWTAVYETKLAESGQPTPKKVIQLLPPK